MNDLVFRLRKRAEIRRQIDTRKSVQEGKPDRIADLLEEAAKCIEQAQQAKPVAMKFKIYKPTVPDPTRQGINNALLPWVYDQDKSSGFDATMWVTPVATLPPPRQPLSDEQIGVIATKSQDGISPHDDTLRFARAIEAAHGIGESQ